MRYFREVVWLGCCLFVATLSIWGLDLDRALAANFFIPGNHPLVWQRWEGMTDPFWLAIYHAAFIPALVLGSAALGLLVLGVKYIHLHRWRRPAVFVLVFLALGPGLVINLMLKDTLGKPRPSEIVEFGGRYPYAQFWERGTGNDNGSFPSGHAAIAFAVMAPWFFLRETHRRCGGAFLVTGLVWGSVVGAARIVQGGHFLSDILWAGALIYLIGWLLARWFAFDRFPPLRPSGVLSA